MNNKHANLVHCFVALKKETWNVKPYFPGKKRREKLCQFLWSAESVMRVDSKLLTCNMNFNNSKPSDYYKIFPQKLLSLKSRMYAMSYLVFTWNDFIFIPISVTIWNDFVSIPISIPIWNEFVFRTQNCSHFNGLLKIFKSLTSYRLLIAIMYQFSPSSCST